MGVNLNHLASSLGLGGQPNANTNYASPSAVTTPGMTPHALLGPTQGQELPAINQSAPGANQNDDAGMQPPPAADAPPADIEVQGQAAPRMSPEAMGMPGMQNTRSADPQSIADLRQQLQDKANMARQLYHPKSEFGTTGILRDVIGNVEDFGRRLLGFSPRYNAEKWSERAYGMTSSNPDVAASATEQAMQYNPERTMPYQQQLIQQQATQANSAATTEYKNSQAAGRYANILSGLGAQLYQVNANADPQTAQANYERTLPAIQASLDKVYGTGVMQAPQQYSPEFARQLAQAGFTGTNVQRAQANTLDNDVRERVAQMHGDVQQKVAAMRGNNQIAVARILANSRMSLAQTEQAIRMLPVSETETKEESGSIIRPTVTTTTTKGYAPGGGGGARPAQPSHPTAGQERKFFNGHYYVRGPNGEAVRVD